MIYFMSIPFSLMPVVPSRMHKLWGIFLVLNYNGLLFVFEPDIHTKISVRRYNSWSMDFFHSPCLAWDTLFGVHDANGMARGERTEWMPSRWSNFRAPWDLRAWKRQRDTCWMPPGDNCGLWETSRHDFSYRGEYTDYCSLSKRISFTLPISTLINKIMY